MIEPFPAVLHIILNTEIILFRSLSIRCIGTSNAALGVRAVESINLMLSPYFSTYVILNVHHMSLLLSF